MLTSHYVGHDGAQEHYLMVTLYQFRYDSGERIIVFYARMRFLWDQLTTSEPMIKTVSEHHLSRSLVMCSFRNTRCSTPYL